jgi:hypothetical protein
MNARKTQSKRVSKLTRRQQTWLDQQKQGLQQLRQQIKADVTNATSQIESYLNLHSMLSGGFELPPMHGWPVSPDFALLLVRQVQHNHYDLIIELGSGTSTVLIAEALRKKTPHASSQSRFVVFEHLKSYFDQTHAQLKQRQLDPLLQLHLTPLQPYEALDGRIYPYYDCYSVLSQCASELTQGARVMVLVDGPPASTGEHARWPAFDVVTAALASANIDLRIDFLLDDYIRQDEKEVAISWEKIATDKSWDFTATRYRLEKDAYLMQLQIPSNLSTPKTDIDSLRAQRSNPSQ